DAINAKKAIQEAINQYIHEDRHTLLTSDDALEIKNTLKQESSAMDTNELDNYLAFDIVEEDTDPLDWWKAN
ncbi:7944_t:CDS:2, partial [Cetraspora pellucida]